VANCSDRLAGTEEGFDEGYHLGFNPQRIWVDDPARQQQRIEILRLRIIRLYIHRQLDAPVGELPGANVLVFR
jgi:hypothetical protein